MQLPPDSTTVDALTVGALKLARVQDTLAELADAFAGLAAGYDSGRQYTGVALHLLMAVEQVHAAREELARL